MTRTRPAVPPAKRGKAPEHEDDGPGQEGQEKRHPEGEIAAADLPGEERVARQAVGEHGPQRPRLLLARDHVRGEEQGDQADDHLDEEDEIDLALDREDRFVVARRLARLEAVLGEIIIAGEGALEALGEDGEGGRTAEPLDGHGPGHDVLDLDGRGGFVGEPDLLAVVPDPLGVVCLVDRSYRGG